jgi:hypothetical protein
MNKTKWLVIVCVVMSAGIADAQAQMIPWEDRGYLSVNIGIQPLSRDFTAVSAPDINDEAAAITVEHNIGSGLFPDFSVGYRLYGNVGVAVGFSRFGKSESPTLIAQIPHPIIGGQLRTATTSAGELSRSETAIHTHLVWMIPLTEEIETAVLIGPSFYTIKQDFIETVTPQEGAPPFNTVSIGSVSRIEESESAVAFTAGIDATYKLSPRYGVGVFFRYSGASVDMPLSGGGTVTVEAGGVQIGGGIRVRF